MLTLNETPAIEAKPVEFANKSFADALTGMATPKSTTTLGRIAERQKQYFFGKASLANIVAQYNYLAIPVVENTGKLIGIITVDDVIDIIQIVNIILN